MLKEIARAKTAEAFQLVVECLQAEDKRVALKAAEIILDRGHGKPHQSLEMEANVQGSLNILTAVPRE